MTCRNALVLTALVTLSALGCGRGNGYDVAQVSGTVMLEGEPLTNAKVMFTPVAKTGSLKSGKAGLGILQEDGAFVVGTYGRDDGAVVAEHRVTVIDRKTDDPGPGRRLGRRRVQLPELFTVEPGEENEFTIELTRDVIAKYGSN